MEAVHSRSAQPWDASPPPSLDASAASADALAPELMMLLAMAKSQGSQKQTATLSIEQAYERLQELRVEIQQAMERAKEAEDEAGFWGGLSDVCGGDVAAMAGFVAATALVLGTGGAGAAAIAAGLALGLAASAKVGQELGLDPKLVLALQLASAAAGVVGGGCGHPQGIWLALRTGGLVVQGSASAAAGGAHIVKGQYDAEALEQRGVAKFGRESEQLEHAQIDLLIAELERLAKEWRFASETAAGTQARSSEGQQQIVMRIGG